MEVAHQGFAECQIRALHRHKSLLPNSAGWWQVGQWVGVVCGFTGSKVSSSCGFSFSILVLLTPQSWIFLSLGLQWAAQAEECSSLFRMNFCMPDMYETPHTGVGGFAVQSSGEHCMYPGESPGYGHYEPQPLHHPPCMEQAWPPRQHYSCSYTAGPSAFKSEFCNTEVPLSHFHHQPDYFPEIKPDFSHLQWMQGVHRKGTDDIICFLLAVLYRAWTGWTCGTGCDVIRS